jgi:hypothetical protein
LIQLGVGRGSHFQQTRHNALLGFGQALKGGLGFGHVQVLVYEALDNLFDFRVGGAAGRREERVYVIEVEEVGVEIRIHNPAILKLP